MQTAGNHDHATHTRLLVRVLQDVLRAETFEAIADVKEALKVRCAQLRIAYDAGLVAEALDRVEKGGQTPIIGRHPSPAPPPLVEDPVVDRDAAARILAELRVRVRSVPRVREVPWDEIRLRAHATDRARAMRVVLDAITETNARIDALEREEP